MKNKINKKIGCIAISLLCVLQASSCDWIFGEENGWINPAKGETAKNIILLIGDGMGPQQIQAGELYKGSSLVMQSIAQRIYVETNSYSGITDSAAGGTAISTGNKTINGFVGMDEDRNELETIVDIAHNLGKRTGIITTEPLYGATPMSFSAHNSSRSNYMDLLESAATTSNVNLFASYFLDNVQMTNVFVNNGYSMKTSVDEISDASEEKIFGTYNIKANAPSMAGTTSNVAFDRLLVESLDYLSKDDDGFFLMAEGARIDHGGHNNDIAYMLSELLAFDDAVKAALDWAKDRNDTVVIVTADHETGGLTLSPTATHETILDSTSYLWTTDYHTSADIYCYVHGAKISFEDYSDFGWEDRQRNTDTFQIMKTLFLGK